MASAHAKVEGVDQKGASAVEFALIAGPLLFLMAGAIEFGLAMLARSMLSEGVREAAEYGALGGGADRPADAERIVREALEPTFSTQELVFEARVHPSFASAKDNPEGGAPGMGGPSQIVRYSASLPWRISTPVVAGWIGEDGEVRLEASITVKNEPFRP